MGKSAVASSGRVRAIQGYPARRQETERDQVPDSILCQTPFLLRTRMVALETDSARHTSSALLLFLRACHCTAEEEQRPAHAGCCQAHQSKLQDQDRWAILLRRLPAVASTPVIVSRSAGTKTPFSVFRILISLGICCRLMAPCIEHRHTQYDALRSTHIRTQASRQANSCLLFTLLSF
jgi:hypothetical protein